jgi:lipopolysaccharide export system permease protein
LFPSLLDKYIAREVFSTLLAVTTVLMLIIIGNLFIRLLGEAAEGRIPQDVILPLLALASFKGVVFLLPVSLFISVLLSLGRLYRDSEMAALRAVGFGYSDLFRPVVVMAIIMGAFMFVMVGYVVPNVVAVSDEMKEVASKRADIIGITPGRFISDPDATRVLYVKEMSEDREELRDIFISLVEQGKDVIITARRARQEVVPETGVRYLLLEDGYRYDSEQSPRQVTRLEFESHGILLPEVIRREQRTRDTLPINDLWSSRDSEDIAELHWRISFPLGALLLSILAVPLSYVSPRQGRYGKLAVAVVIYGLYANFLIVGKSWLAKGMMPTWGGLWWAHILLLIIAVILITRQYGMSWTLKHRFFGHSA